MARHPYALDCSCARCDRERSRRAAQSAADWRNAPRPARKRRSARRNPDHASRAEQAARYLDAGPLAWDDRD